MAQRVKGGHASDDRALALRARDGDLDAFDVLVARHAHMVYALALRLLGSAADAEDATQEAFLRAWQSLRTFRGDSSFRTWIYRITTNRCLNQLERERRTDPLPESDVVTSSSPGPEQITQARAQVADLRRVLALLTPEQRAVLVLREFQGCSHDEMAVILGITVGSVKGRLHRARVAVIEAMDAWA